MVKIPGFTCFGGWPPEHVNTANFRWTPAYKKYGLHSGSVLAVMLHFFLDTVLKKPKVSKFPAKKIPETTETIKEIKDTKKSVLFLYI